MEAFTYNEIRGVSGTVKGNCTPPFAMGFQQMISCSTWKILSRVPGRQQWSTKHSFAFCLLSSMIYFCLHVRVIEYFFCGLEEKNKLEM